MSKIIEALNWRYATKAYDTTKKVSTGDMQTLLESARLAPSSYGLQPWRMVHVTNPEVRTKLKTAAWEQPQFTDASDIIVFAVETVFDEARVDAFIGQVATERGLDAATALAGYKGMILGTLNSRSKEENISWAGKQAYIALGMLLETAALMNIDATPMEGFDAKQFDEILGLTSRGLRSVVVCALGYRDITDSYAQMKKVRPEMDKMVIEIK